MVRNGGGIAASSCLLQDERTMLVSDTHLHSGLVAELHARLQSDRGWVMVEPAGMLLLGEDDLGLDAAHVTRLSSDRLVRDLLCPATVLSQVLA
jgi:hypothetical protein